MSKQIVSPQLTVLSEKSPEAVEGHFTEESTFVASSGWVGVSALHELPRQTPETFGCQFSEGRSRASSTFDVKSDRGSNKGKNENFPVGGVDEDDYLFEAPLCEGGTLKILHSSDLVCQLLTLETIVKQILLTRATNVKQILLSRATNVS